MIYILNATIKDFRNEYFHSFVYRCVYDTNFTNMENNEDVLLTIIPKYMKFKSQFYGLNKKVKTALKKGFRFTEIVK